jgi:hypothetical protein
MHYVSRQLPLAAEASALLRFHLRHLEQQDQHAKLVAPRQPGELSDRFDNEDGRLVRPAIPRLLIALRALVPAPGPAGSPRFVFVKKDFQQDVF